jgi:hypothetical protein
MKSDEFVKVIKEVVKNSAISGTLKNLELPPGRKPAKELIELSNWYNKLDNKNKMMLQRVLDMATDSCMFGFLAVIDGVRSMEDVKDKGELELYYVNGGIKERLNNPNEEYLHDIYKSLD